LFCLEPQIEALASKSAILPCGIRTSITSALTANNIAIIAHFPSYDIHDVVPEEAKHKAMYRAFMLILRDAILAQVRLRIRWSIACQLIIGLC